MVSGRAAVRSDESAGRREDDEKARVGTAKFESGPALVKDAVTRQRRNRRVSSHGPSSGSRGRLPRPIRRAAAKSRLSRRRQR
jgi:hypothetical protein